MIFINLGKTGFLLIAITGTLGQVSGTVMVAGKECMTGPVPSCSTGSPKLEIFPEDGWLLFESSDPSLLCEEKKRLCITVTIGDG